MMMMVMKMRINRGAVVYYMWKLGRKVVYIVDNNKESIRQRVRVAYSKGVNVGAIT